MNDVLHTLNAHAWYAWSGVGLVLLLWLVGRYTLRVRVADNWLLFYDSRERPKKPGFHFMPYEYYEVNMKPRLIRIGHDELQTTSRVDTYRERGVRPEKESVVTRTPIHKKGIVVISWIPDSRHLADYLQRHPDEIEDTIRQLFHINPLLSFIDSRLQSLKMGALVIEMLGAPPPTTQSVSLADGVDIPYEG